MDIFNNIVELTLWDFTLSFRFFCFDFNCRRLLASSIMIDCTYGEPRLKQFSKTKTLMHIKLCVEKSENTGTCSVVANQSEVHNILNLESTSFCHFVITFNIQIPHLKKLKSYMFDANFFFIFNWKLDLTSSGSKTETTIIILKLTLREV